MKDKTDGQICTYIWNHLNCYTRIIYGLRYKVSSPWRSTFELRMGLGCSRSSLCCRAPVLVPGSDGEAEEVETEKASLSSIVTLYNRSKMCERTGSLPDNKVASSATSCRRMLSHWRCLSGLLRSTGNKGLFFWPAKPLYS